MKKSIFSKVGAAAVVLTLVTTSLVGGTFAKYTTTVNGSAQVTTAAWAVKFKEGNTEITTTPITLKATNTEGVVADKIAPGSYGELALTVDGSGAEVDFEYSITLEAADSATFDGLVFYSDETRADEKKITFPYKADVKAKDTNNVSIYWEWKDGEDQNKYADKDNLIYNLTMTATQKTPTEPTPAP